LHCWTGARDPYAAPPQEALLLEAITRPPRKLRIALMLKDLAGRVASANVGGGNPRTVRRLGTVSSGGPLFDMWPLRPSDARMHLDLHRSMQLDTAMILQHQSDPELARRTGDGFEEGALCGGAA